MLSFIFSDTEHIKTDTVEMVGNKPTKWFVCKEEKDKLPRDIKLTPKEEDRLFFVDENYENGLSLDENVAFYLEKSIAELKLHQNPITYLNL